MHKQILYPFTAIVGQEEVKKSLLLNLICPQIGGVLLSGQKGTAKSTIVRALAALYPGKEVITLPLNATEDRVLGSISMEKALKEGKQYFEPGVLARAHNQILYIDEVNLLSGSLVNTILDVAASGINRVEREGISHVHSCRFVLIGTMNPEEGGLKPQLLDRFGFFVDVNASTNVRERVEVMKKRMRFEADPHQFYTDYQEQEKELLRQLSTAENQLNKVDLSTDILQMIADVCMQAGIAGHRGDLALAMGAKALAAFRGKKKVDLKEVQEVRNLALLHRLRNAQNPQEENDDDNESEEEEEQQQQPNSPQNEKQEEESGSDQTENQEIPLPELAPEESDNDDSGKEELFEIGEAFGVPNILETEKDKLLRQKGNGKRSKTKTDSLSGRYVRVKYPKGKIKDLAFDATLRAAAPYQAIREKNGMAVRIEQADFREKVREKRIGNTIFFLVDASGSMGVQKRMSEAKTAVYSLLQDAYKKRDRVGLMSFRGETAEMVLPPTRSIDLAYRKLQELKTGGRTPLASALEQMHVQLKAMQGKDKEMLPVIVILTDGKANWAQGKVDPLQESYKKAEMLASNSAKLIVVDTESGFLRLGLASRLAEKLNAGFVRLDELKSGELAGKVKEIVNL
ncbi:MAG: VWA domain-containing protein [Marinifilaceae bacterium]